jgi:hypothetical protein
MLNLLIKPLALSTLLLVAVSTEAQAMDLSCEQPGTSLTGDAGVTFEVTCPADCADSTVWGAGPYTDDSSVCVAAIHAGTITTAGGSFTVTITGAAPSFPGSTANGVTTSDWGEWGRSFTATNAGGYPVLDCSSSAQQLESGNFLCPSGCTTGGTVWGSGQYTDDSSVCRAAIHSGVSEDGGGTISLEIQPGLESYDGSNMNGVESLSYPAWGRSFTFTAR